MIRDLECTQGLSDFVDWNFRLRRAVPSSPQLNTDVPARA